MNLRQIAKRQQEKAFVRLHGPQPVRLRGGYGMGRLLPGHRLYEPHIGRVGFSVYRGYQSYEG